MLLVALAVPTDVAAITDDFEDEAWHSFTHFHLGNRAWAGYVASPVHSGTHAFHVEIRGWTVRDYGSAYGYELYATGGSPVVEMRLSLYYESLADSVRSPFDAFAAGVAVQLLDADLRDLGTVRYVTAYAASQNGGRCGPTTADTVLSRAPTLGVWHDVARSPAADFPAALWSSARFVKVSAGFLCTAGLDGASYALDFDDFWMQTGAGDTDGDGIEDLEENARVYSMFLEDGSGPLAFPSGETIAATIEGPRPSGAFRSAAVAFDLVHPRLQDLSASLEVSNGAEWVSHLIWDPGFRERGILIRSPLPDAVLRSTVPVNGLVSSALEGNRIRISIDGIGMTVLDRAVDGTFREELELASLAEGAHTLRAALLAAPTDSSGSAEIAAASVTFTVDRSPPNLVVRLPSNDTVISGLVDLEAQASDASGVVAVDLWVDGSLYDTVYSEPFAFPYDTPDLTNERHAFELRARDAAGNEARSTRVLVVSNLVAGQLRPCFPACNLTSGTSSGELGALSPDLPTLVVPLASADVLRVRDSFRVAWTPEYVRGPGSIHVVADLAQRTGIRVSDDLVDPSLTPQDLTTAQAWRLVFRDHGALGGGMLLRWGVNLAFGTLASRADTDGDGMADGAERSLGRSIPVLADTDGDGLPDGLENGLQSWRFSIDGRFVDRTFRTNPLDPDTDDDGLADGRELHTEADVNASNPTDADTDDDGLLDGLEVLTYGSDPTLTDTDGDTLTDFDEVHPRELAILVDGILTVRSIATSPALDDTDGDGLRDNEEWSGAERYGFPTDPTDPDTDRDGLSDLDELAGLNRRPTNPDLSDTDGDGLIDGLDLSPTELWNLGWKTTFEPGVVRFTQRFNALGVQGLFAQIWTYNVVDDACYFLSDHTSDATRSSNESSSDVLGMLNRVLVDGGETNYTALVATNPEEESFGVAEYDYGACDFWSPRQYRIGYIHDSHTSDVDFVNTAEVAIRDDAGELFYHASMDIPIRLSKPQSIVVQFAIDPAADRGEETSDGTTVVPAIVYSLFTGADFFEAPPFYRNLAVGAAIDDHAYEFQLRIPEGVARAENVAEVDGVPMATLTLMPMWLTTGGSTAARSALNATYLATASAVSRIQEQGDLIIARLATDMDSLEAVLPDSSADLTTGFQSFGSFSAYVYRMGDAFDIEAPSAADVVYLTGDSPEEIASFQDTIDWAPEAAWVRKSQDGFGTVLKVFKMIRQGISISSQLTANILVPVLNVPSGAMEEMSFGRSLFTVTKLTNVETDRPYYVVGETTVETVKLRVPHPEIPGLALTEVRVVEREIRGEIVDDLADSRLLTGVKYSHLRSALRGAALGATLVIFGSQAVLAFRDGDIVKGAVYVLAGATAVFGVVRSDAVFVERLFEARAVTAGVKIRVGVVAAIAVGGILASHEVFQAGQTDNPIERLSHYESAGTIVVDTIIAVVPLYGAAAMLGWQLGLTITVGADALFGILPNTLALKIVSTPGTAVTFLFEYVFGSEIPSDVAQDALIRLLNFLADAAKFGNSLDPPIPTLLLVP